MNYENYVFFHPAEKNFEDLVIDAIIYPRTFLELVNNPVSYERIKDNYQVNDYKIDVVISFLEKYKKNFFNLLYHVDYINSKLEDFNVDNEFVKLFIEVLKKFIEDNMIDVEKVLKNVYIAVKEEVLFDFFNEEIKELLFFILDWYRKNHQLLTEKEIELLDEIFRIINKSEFKEDFDILSAKYRRLKK